MRYYFSEIIQIGDFYGDNTLLDEKKKFHTKL